MLLSPPETAVSCIYEQCISLVSEILRVIILGLARYHSAVPRKKIIINGLDFFAGWILRKGKWDTAHAQYPSVNFPRKIWLFYRSRTK